MVHRLSHPHGDADGTVHVAFAQPAVLGDATFLRSQGGRILQGTKTLRMGSTSPCCCANWVEISHSFFGCAVAKCWRWFINPPTPRLSAQELFDAAVWDETELNMMQLCPFSNRQRKIKQTMSIKPDKYPRFPCNAKTNSLKQPTLLWS